MLFATSAGQGSPRWRLPASTTALWDLKARLLDLPLVTLLGPVRDGTPVYGSGGFTSYSIEQLQRQLGGWVGPGIPRVKMKIGTHPEDDLARVRAAREAIGADTRALRRCERRLQPQAGARTGRAFAESDVSWFEEPVSSDDLDGLRLVRDRAPACMDVRRRRVRLRPVYFRRMLEAGAVDVLQADATRCAGITDS